MVLNGEHMVIRVLNVEAYYRLIMIYTCIIGHLDSATQSMVHTDPATARLGLGLGLELGYD